MRQLVEAPVREWIAELRDESRHALAMALDFDLGFADGDDMSEFETEEGIAQFTHALTDKELLHAYEYFLDNCAACYTQSQTPSCSS